MNSQQFKEALAAVASLPNATPTGSACARCSMHLAEPTQQYIRDEVLLETDTNIVLLGLVRANGLSLSAILDQFNLPPAVREKVVALLLAEFKQAINT